MSLITDEAILLLLIVSSKLRRKNIYVHERQSDAWVIKIHRNFEKYKKIRLVKKQKIEWSFLARVRSTLGFILMDPQMNRYLSS